MKKRFGLKRFKWSVAIASILLVSLTFYSFNDDKRNFEIAKNLDIFYTMFRELNSYYVDETNPEELMKTGIDKMLESLDPYTTYIPESEIDDFKFMTTGQYGGIGSLISKRGEYVVIAEPYEGFPAQKSGLKAGDRIIEIDGKNVAGKNTSDVSELLKGPANTKVKVTIDRPGSKKTLNIEIEREKIQIDAVPYYGMVNKTTGYILLNNFTQNCYRQVETALFDLKERQGAKSIILDLRGNPGGLLDEAVKITNLFVPQGSEVVRTIGKIKQLDKVYKATRPPVDTIIPLAVLINRGSASASEIVAGSLQDLDRAIIIGQRSFGKGLVQTTRNLSYNAKLKITTAKYYTPSGRCIQALDYSHRNEDGSVGVVPDSLITEFNTQNGRKVYDGGGISPDVTIEKPKYGNITYAIVTQSMIFDFATQFVLDHEKIEGPENFTINPEIYNTFKQFVAAKEDFKYESASQEHLKELIEIAKKEEYYSVAQEQFNALNEVLKLDVNKDLDIFNEEIKELMAMEITKRYYYQKGAIIQGLKDDKELSKAKEVLGEQEQYNGILDGTILSHAGDKRK